MPARDEAASIGAALQALLPQIAAASLPFELLVLANNCRDRTVEVARETAARHGASFVHVAEASLEGHLASAGHARRLLMEQAALRLQGAEPGTGHGARHGVPHEAKHGLILSTDADTRVDPNWLPATLHEFELGADAVGGRILTLADAERPAGIVQLQRLDAAYRLLRAKLESIVDPDPADPWPRHHQHFGASLAVRMSALARAGGPPQVPCMEDEALVAALRREDCRVRHSPNVRVWTSGRLDGRAEVGLSWQLRQWQHCVEAGRLPSVRDPHRELAVWRWRCALRTAWQAARVGRSQNGLDKEPKNGPQNGPRSGGLNEPLTDLPELPAGSQNGSLNPRQSHPRRLALPPPPAGLSIDALVSGSSLAESIRSARSFGRLWEMVGGTVPGADDEVPLDQAIETLRRLLTDLSVVGPVRPSRARRPGHRQPAGRAAGPMAGQRSESGG